MELPSTFQHRIVEFLTSLPSINDTSSQQALICQAALDQDLQQQIPFGTPSAQFIPLLVSKLGKYGKLTDGRYAVEAVLEAAKSSVGQDKKADCDALLQEFHENADAFQLGHVAVEQKIQELRESYNRLHEEVRNSVSKLAQISEPERRHQFNHTIQEIESRRDVIHQELRRFEHLFHKYWKGYDREEVRKNQAENGSGHEDNVVSQDLHFLEDRFRKYLSSDTADDSQEASKVIVLILRALILGLIAIIVILIKEVAPEIVEFIVKKLPKLLNIVYFP
ncbi:MAG: hypothetical protein ACFFCW_17810 [Candidatus Hodarchaeota archaeon]